VRACEHRLQTWRETSSSTATGKIRKHQQKSVVVHEYP
jgi:hypothetical protein